MFEQIAQKFSTLFSKITGSGVLAEAQVDRLLAEVQDTLLEADVPYEAIEDFSASLRTDIVGKKIPAGLKADQFVMKVVHDRVVQFLGAATTPLTFDIPSTCMVMGLQGAGKTTTIAKLAQYMKKEAEKRGKSRRILLASVDFYRPAAVDQLELLAQRVGCLFYRAQATEPLVAAREIQQYVQREGVELLFLDTAGRMHIDDTLMAELQQIEKLMKPKYKLLVVDGMMGQESLSVAQGFEAAVGFTGAIVTKMDSDAKAGVVFAFRYLLQKPIFFMGTGEGIDDFSPFLPDRIAQRMLDMGDMLTLIEAAQEKVKESEQKRLEERLLQGSMTLQDFADQMAMMHKLGSLRTLVQYLPGMGQLKVDGATLDKGQADMNRMGAIISSMTMKERLVPKLLDASRKQRIAQGAGVSVGDINNLLARFEQMKQFGTLFKKMKQFRS